LLHWRKSQSVRTELLVRSLDSTDSAEYFISNASSPLSLKSQHLSPQKEKKNRIQNQLKIETGTGTSKKIKNEIEMKNNSFLPGTPLSLYRSNILSPSPVTNFSTLAVSSSDNRKNANSEHQLLTQERLNIRLTAQIKAWVSAQVELHTQLANEEATGILNRRFADRGTESGIKSRIFGVEESALSEVNYLNENNEGNYNQNIDNKIKNENERVVNIECDDVSYISRKEKRTDIIKPSFSMENSMANSTLNFPMSPFQDLVRGSCDSPRITRNLFQGPEKMEIKREENNLNSSFLMGINLGEKIMPGIPEITARITVKKEELSIPMSPQYSQLLLVESNNENNDASLLSECFRSDFLSKLLETEIVQNTVSTSLPLISKDIFMSENQIILDKSVVGNIVQSESKQIENGNNTEKKQSPQTEILKLISSEKYQNKNEISLLLENENSLKIDPNNVSIMTYVKNSVDVSTDDILSPLQKRLIAKSVEKKAKVPSNSEINISSPVSVPYSVTYALLCGEKMSESNIESEKMNKLPLKNSSPESLTRTYVDADSTAISTDKNMDDNNNISQRTASPSPKSTIKIPNTEGKIFEKLLSRKIIPLVEKSPPKIQVPVPHIPYRPVRDYLNSEFPLLYSTENTENENEVVTQTIHTASLPLPLSNTTLYNSAHEKEDKKEMQTENPIPVSENKNTGSNNEYKDKYRNGSVNTEMSSGNNDYCSVFERESYLIPPVGLSMRSLSRERGGSVPVSMTQNKSSQLQAKLRYGYTVRAVSYHYRFCFLSFNFLFFSVFSFVYVSLLHSLFTFSLDENNLRL
jgi:hypothetical protein